MARISELLTTLLRRRTPDGDPLPDGVLLGRFARTRDPAAFELLVWRHGPMVLAACRRVLRDDHAAEDAFQAAFLVLARKAGGVRGSAAGWLHRVALRVCLRMKRRRLPVSLDAEPVAAPDPDAVEAAERSAILDEEVARLPEWLRVPVVVCHLQGHTTERAAELLDIPRGTVLSRLATARKRLTVRLTARGVAPILAVVAVTELSADAGRTVAETAVGFALGKATSNVPVQLALEVLSMTRRTTVAVAAAVLILTAGLGTGIGFVAAQGQGGKQPPATTGDPPAHPLDKPKTASTDAKETTDRRDRIEKLLKTVDAQLQELRKSARDEQEDPAVLREQLRAMELRYQDLHARVRTERLVIPPELAEALETAQQRLTAARTAAVPADVLAEAVQSHPKVVEARAKLNAVDDVLRNKPRSDPERKKREDERPAVLKELQTIEKQVGPEVEAYLRAPGVVETKKAAAMVEARVRQLEMKAMATREEYELVAKEVATLRQQLKTVEPAAEEMTWLKDKRKRLKQELLELELKELGIGK